MSKILTGGCAGFIGILIGVIVTPLLILTHAFVVMNYWQWIMVSQFGLEPISYWLAFLIVAIIVYLGNINAPLETTTVEKDFVIKFFGRYFAMPIVYYIIGYIIFTYGL